MMLQTNILLIIFLFFVTLFVNKVKSSSYDIVSCSTQNNISTYILQPNTITFFESPNFPKSLSDNSLCSAQFQTGNESLYIWIAILNGAAPKIAFSDEIYDLHKQNTENYDSNFDIVTFETWSNGFTVQVNATSSQGTWTAFQAALGVFYDGTDYTHCPFSAQTFDFNANPNLIIPIANNYASNSDSENKTCDWIFTCNSSQQLKIVVKNIEIADEVQLILYGNQDVIVKNFITEDSSQVYYFTGTLFHLKYEYKFANTSDIKFFILISAVIPNNNIFSSQGCQMPQINATAGKTIFSNIDYTVGYPPYQRCENSVYIPAGFEGTFSITQAYYESCCDKLTVIYGNNQTQLITWENKQQPIQYILTHDINSAQNNLIFTSDGNTEGAGFTAELQLYECKCANLNFHVECNTTTTYYPLENSYTYCSNMDCIYMIAPNFNCPDTYLHLIVVNSLRKNSSSSDYIVLRENGNIEQNMTSDTGALDRYYSSKNSMTLQFHSDSALLPVVPENKFWFVYLTSMPSPNFLPPITLNSNTKPKHILWLPDDIAISNDALTVCTENGILELFVTSDNFMGESGYSLYDSNDLNYYIGDLNQISQSDPSLSPSLPRSIKSTSGCFTIYLSTFSSYNNGHTVMFRIFDETAENNCQSENTVFQITYDGEYDVSVTSGDSGTCEMIILALTGFPNEIPHIWLNNITTDYSDGQFIFMSLVNNKILFEFNGTEASEWQSIGIYTLALSIIIPPSSEISIHLSSNDQISEYINVVEYGIQKGIMASPSYCGIMETFGTTQIYQVTGPVSFAIDFIVKDVFGNPNPVLQNYPNNQTLLQNNETMIVYNFQVYYAEDDPEKNGFLIEYTIQGNVPIPTEETSTSTIETTEATEITSKGTTPLHESTTSITRVSTTSSQSPTETSTNIPSEHPTVTVTTTQASVTYKKSSTERRIKTEKLFIYVLIFIFCQTFFYFM